MLITRARERMIVVTALTGAGGVIGDYLAFSETPPPAPAAPVDLDHEWTAALATELRRTGRTVRCDYPVGRWRVDLCLGDADAIGLVTRVHPDGMGVHIDRQRSLTRAGWRLVDGFASRWGGDPVRAALHLSA